MINKNVKLRFFIFFIFIYCLIHLLTLSISPIVWQDETFFASISNSFSTGNSLKLEVSPEYLQGRPISIYGPVYFVCSGAIIKLFGLGLFQSRILGLISGFLICLFVYLIGLRRKATSTLAYLVFFAFLLDVFFNSSLHKGRNDTLALLLYFTSLLLFIRNYKTNKVFLFISGIIYALSIITTPRILFTIPGFLIVAVFDFFATAQKKNTVFNIALWLIPVLLIPVAAILIAFGNFHNYLEYVSMVSSQMQKFFLQGSTIPIEEIPLVVTFGLCLLLMLAKFKIGELLDRITIILLSNVIFYYFLVVDVGPYSVLVIPFLYLIIINFFIRFIEKYGSRRILLLLILPLLSFNILVYSIKNTYLLLDYRNRQYAEVTGYVKANIPSNSHVIGDEVYYYAVMNSGSKFQYMHLHYPSLDTIEHYRRIVFDYDYLFLSDRLNSRFPDIYKLYAKNSYLKKVGRFGNHQKPFFNISWITKKYDFSANGYAGTLYKRLKYKSLNNVDSMRNIN